MLQSYNGPATVLYLHLDENLTGSPRTGTVTVITEDGAEKTLNLSQLPALRIGRFGYAAGTTTDVNIYTADLYTEQLYEYPTMPRYLNLSPNDDGRATPDNALYNGRRTAINPSVFDWSNYQSFDYQSAVFQAINYCAHKNRITSSSNVSADLKWYLPAQAQLMGMWISYNGIDSTHTNFYRIENSERKRADIFWSSTDNNGFATEAQNLNFLYGNAGHYQRAIPYWARCVRDVTPSGSLPPTSSMIETGTEGYPVINFENGMPATSYTTIPKTPYAIGDENSAENKTVYKKLRVAIEDLSASGMEWDSSACRGYSEITTPTTYWRLPTQRELQAIWILQSEIRDKISGFNLLADTYYWSATSAKESYGTEPYGANAWTIYGSRTVPGSSGNAPHQYKQLTTEQPSVRCVSEVQP
jgi:hypothetical protein